ncbi:glycosyltransferase family 61 protein [Lichenicola sp.]|uniref:glycosyltransferase family 61 protein n=1 Tax=Lichenicola sp. TaxID=2804529 RepID=UPI003B003248
MTEDYLYVKDAVRQRMPGFEYEEASPVEHHLRPSPRLLIGPVPREFGRWHYGDREAPAVGLYRIDDVTLQYDRILRQRGRTICIEQNGMHPGSIAQAVQPPDLRPIEVSGEVVLLCGPAYQMYGHWLVDFLPRLHVLTRLGLDLEALTYLLPHNIMPFARQWLSLLRIRDEQIRSYDTVTDRCEIERVLIPTGFRGDGRANTLLADALRDYKTRIIGTPELPATRRVFVSRRRWGNDSRSLVNAQQVEEQLAADGFEIVFPEEMSTADQVTLFAGSRLLVGEYGSGLHNSIFAGSSATVVAFRGAEGHPGFLQTGLCDALGQDIGYVFCSADPASDNPQHFQAAAPDLKLLRSLLPEM